MGERTQIVAVVDALGRKAMEDISRGLNLKRSLMSEFELRSVNHESRSHARQSRADAKLPALLTHALSSDTPCARPRCARFGSSWRTSAPTCVKRCRRCTKWST